MSLGLVTGLCSAVVLLLAGYLFGAKRGLGARRALARQLEEREDALRGQVQVVSDALVQRDQLQKLLETNLGKAMEGLAAKPSGGADLKRELRELLTPIIEKQEEAEGLRSTVHELLTPLMHRERLGQNLARLELGSGLRGDLPRLLARIAETGGFSTVLLSDEAGLPLASNGEAKALDRLTGLCSLMTLVVDRMRREGTAKPRALLVHDESNQEILSRLFEVAGQRLLLTVVSSGTTLSPTALDPALSKLTDVLMPVRESHQGHGPRASEAWRT
ncbi:MAG: hypothetical protein H6729_16425 [Deltaproteobacteria bacterium]|nr:hypothetical protein [Deltaproteobacteria bacterium]